jgi:hypothetical protein
LGLATLIGALWRRSRMGLVREIVTGRVGEER